MSNRDKGTMLHELNNNATDKERNEVSKYNSKILSCLEKEKEPLTTSEIMRQET